jgi:hypothetical protein
MTIGLRWVLREPPLVPAAVVGFDEVVPGLAAAVRERLGRGVELRAAGDVRALLVLGMAADLPWADGARYLGWDGGMLTLTTHRPLPAAGLWRQALLREIDEGRLVALLPGRALVTAAPRRAADAGLLPA